MAPLKPEISVQYTETATIITFTKEKILEERDIQNLQQSIMPVIEQSEQVHFILDFRNVQFLSSAVLGLLLRISKKVYEKNSTLRMCGINPKIYEIFKITRLNRIFDIYDDLDAAQESLSAAD
jgi:anti-sigma B factor antagonist